MTVVFHEVSVHPAVAPKAYRERDSEVEAGVPMNDEQDVEQDLAYPEHVRVVGEGLRLVEEIHHSR